MDDELKVFGGALVGAAIGSLTAYLFLTEQGRRSLSQLPPALLDLSQVLQEIRDTFGKVSDVAVEGRRAAEDVRAAFRRKEFADAADRWQ